MIPTGHLERMSPAEIIAFVATNTLAVISNWSTEELIRIGWIGNPIVDILYSLTSAGVWIAQTNASGLVTEANSAAISGRIESTYNSLLNSDGLSRLNDVIGGTATILSSARPLKRAAIDLTLGAGGTLAATQLVPLVAGKSIYPEEVDLTLIPLTANLGAVGGHAALIRIQDDAGVPIVCGEGAVTHVKHHLNMKMLGKTTVTQDLDIVVEVGLGANHVNASRLVGHVLYREI